MNIAKQIAEEFEKLCKEYVTVRDIVAALARRANCNPQSHPLSIAYKKGMPKEFVLKAGWLWLSKNPKNWSKARDLVFSYTSPYGKYFNSPMQPKLPLETKRVEYNKGSGKYEISKRGKN